MSRVAPRVIDTAERDSHESISAQQILGLVECIRPIVCVPRSCRTDRRSLCFVVARDGGIDTVYVEQVRLALQEQRPERRVDCARLLGR